MGWFFRSPKSARRSARHISSRRPNSLGAPPYLRRLGMETLEERRLLYGLTLITHGFTLDPSPMVWVTSMANEVIAQISSRFNCNESDVAEIQLTVNSDLTITPTWINYADPGTSKSAETVVLLDWTAVAGLLPIESTVAVAAAVAPCLYEPLPALGLNEPLAQGPIQLIGHSRGGSLVGQLAEDLGQQGIWVDQVTTLDPCPWSLASDAPMTAWSNVVFWDNYWEDTFPYPQARRSRAPPTTQDLQTRRRR